MKDYENLKQKTQAALVAANAKAKAAEEVWAAEAAAEAARAVAEKAQAEARAGKEPGKMRQWIVNDILAARITLAWSPLCNRPEKHVQENML